MPGRVNLVNTFLKIILSDFLLYFCYLSIVCSGFEVFSRAGLRFLKEISSDRGEVIPTLFLSPPG